MPNFPRLPCICVAGWKLCKWKITFCPHPLRCMVLTEESWRGSEVSNGTWGTSSSGCLHSCNYKMEQPSGISDAACSFLCMCSFLNMPIPEVLEVAFFGLYTMEAAYGQASGLSVLQMYSHCSVLLYALLQLSLRSQSSFHSHCV